MYQSGLLSDDIKPGTSLFSSLLPFGRADFGPSSFLGGQKINDLGNGGDGFLYLLELLYPLVPSSQATQVVAAAGAAKLRITPKLGNRPFYPYMQQAGVDFLYAGNDWLTILDACALDDSLAVDIFSLFPVETALDPGLSTSSSEIFNKRRPASAAAAAGSPAFPRHSSLAYP